MRRSMITYKEKNVQLTEWGEGYNPTIVCLHGLGSTSLSFLEVAEKLQKNFHIIAFDAPGHGKSEPFDTSIDYEMPRLVDWLNGLLKHLNVSDFYFLTHSWGSFLALHYLVRYPEHILDTILIDGGYQTKRIWSSSLEEEMDHYEKDFDEYAFDSWNDFFLAEKENYLMWSPLKDIAVKDLGVEREGKVRWHAKGETARHIIRGMHLNETEDIYHLLPPDITLLVATLPERLSEKRWQTAETFRVKAKGKLKVVPNTTHLLHWDNPNVVVDLVLSKWLKKSEVK
ncbi:lipase [Fictibacillus phosphorivorans]|uniref:Lipase n=1 Tax=Fictibacillus phosphorivorans TaxID=1221500 RepID=A0A160IJY0_9BACL|nr:alpha/beta hydrolase [Fictibacillus phosphorivorans]ANC76201.1 lipase [Fictibacillus phosphorivorans]